jgi:hypothetical protein
MMYEDKKDFVVLTGLINDNDHMNLLNKHVNEMLYDHYKIISTNTVIIDGEAVLVVCLLLDEKVFS